MAKWVYKFHEGSAAMRNLLGGKGCNLAEMTNLGMPIPQGFTVTTEACTEYYNCGKQISDEIQNQIFEAITWMESINNKKFGDTEDPLLVSVRSGARASMPGMMDTILNLGLNDVAVEGFAKKTGNPRFAYDSYRRFIQMYSDVVMEVPKSHFEKIIDAMKEAKGVHFDTELTADDLKELADKFKAVYKEAMNGEEFPQDPKEQLMGAVKAVFRSWDNPRAIVYRRMNDIPGDWGTAVNVQTMVFGNKGETSGTGVAFTRNPSTGEKGIYGEYLINAQGEDVVAGVRTPQPISKLAEDLPECYEEFMNLAMKLENHFRDMQDMEFTIEEGKLYFLQTRNGKRTAPAAIQIACDLVDEGMITPEEAVCRIEAKSLDQLLHPTFVPEALKAGEVIGSALPASPGAAAGKVYFTADEAKDAGKGGRGERVILVRLETSPEDIEGMHAAQGILTVRGGMTSHAAVVARGMGTCCVSGCGEIKIDEEAKVFELGGYTFHEGDYISLDGSTGKIYKGDIATQEATVSGNFERIMEWADKFRTLRVRTNADTPADTLNAVKLGAEGIGLCRTEHMFFDAERIPKIRKMILSETVEQREEALNELIPFQKGDFKAMFKALEGRPMTVRYLDPPLHEFVPTDPEDIKALAEDMGMTVEAVKDKCADLHEFNPMMGHRGCRLAVTYPEIARMQTRAIMEAAIEVKEECGYDIVPEIMIPLVGEKKELKFVKDIVIETAELVKKEKNSDIQYHIGTMIEIPRAALTADKIAEEAEFFSFGTNDLTQMTFGFSRDDAGKFLDSYYKAKIYESDPFARLDQDGVGQLVKMAVEKGRSTRADLKCGICGEHGGDPSSVEFCHKIGLNYVSCSPFRVPIARLAAAQAALNNK
ncbi:MULTISPECIES: pyruvate, phosphate dikinase [Clostridia]|jgi:pyruvate, orthophosphate dikinase|uniref:Pyruvate, phosphate dikinase n=3 Tax=Enterocloster citroniae TaxID=358743 RepID=A0A3E2VQK9_9FIRM|nr:MULTISPECIES: pyruvate, phosphate dikinase [Clostridia]EHE96516.1 pyruvate, phosphate dikinase [ [[Clostridium] citroniae WAL-17108]KJJ72514.1 pyruvate, phosphate dikinase [Clostridium sp. FS41]KMW23038.1 pyruvate [[Clostridium] citroniae WAL-19142]MBT9808211.1 pyruvate, phosphate dikinase [Enterocloster citroniae]MCB7065117.1 pyruvate, phosphate dikinase [Enterocloster citroniae]